MGRLATAGPLGGGLAFDPASEETKLRTDALQQLLALLPKATSSPDEMRSFLSRNPAVQGVDLADDATTLYVQDENPRRVLRLPKSEAEYAKIQPLSRASILGAPLGSSWAAGLSDPGFGEIEWDKYRPYYQERLRQQVRAASSNGLKFLAIESTGTSPAVFFDDGDVHVSKNDWKKLAEGTRLPPVHQLSRRLAERNVYVVTGSPLVARAESPLTKVNDESVYALQKSYPEVLFVRDPPGEETNQRVAHLATLENRIPDGVIAVVADKSFKVRDGKLIQNLQMTLREQGVSVQTFAGEKTRIDAPRGSVVIAIAGHIDAELVAFVRALGKSGALKGNFVLLTSCEAKASRHLHTEIVQKFGAAASFSYQGILHTSTLDPFLVHLAESLQKQRSLARPGAPPTTPSAHRGFTKILRETLRAHGLNGVWVATRINDGSLAPVARGPSMPLAPRGNPERARRSPNAWG